MSGLRGHLERRRGGGRKGQGLIVRNRLIVARAVVLDALPDGLLAGIRHELAAFAEIGVQRRGDADESEAEDVSADSKSLLVGRSSERSQRGEIDDAFSANRTARSGRRDATGSSDGLLSNHIHILRMRSGRRDATGSSDRPLNR